MLAIIKHAVDTIFFFQQHDASAVVQNFISSTAMVPVAQR